MTQVPGANGVAAMNGSRTDEQVCEGNHLPDSSRIGVHFCGDLRHFLAEALYWNGRKHSVQIIPPILCLFCRLGPMKAVFQLDGDRREHHLILAVLLLECRQQAADWPGFAFGDDQNAGIQD
jgi:hypothetical protein